jgi:hypothetical protein
VYSTVDERKKIYPRTYAFVLGGAFKGHTREVPHMSTRNKLSYVWNVKARELLQLLSHTSYT